VGTRNETSSDVARAMLPKLKNLRDERVLFMGLSKQDGFSNIHLNGYDMISRR
jgi:hypothetical protein